MRISGNCSSDDYWLLHYHHEPRVRILLDGQQIRSAVFADEEAGTVTINVQDEAGNVQFKDGEIVTRTLTGRVEIIGERRQLG